MAYWASKDVSSASKLNLRSLNPNASFLISILCKSSAYYMHGRFLRIVLLFWADLFGSMMASFLPEKNA